MLSSFSSIFRVAQSICETTRVFSMMSKREFWHPQVIGQIMLLSRVSSHKLSTASAPLVGRLTLLEGGCSLLSACAVPCSCGSVVSERWYYLPGPPPPSSSPSPSPLTGGGVGPPTPIGMGGPLGFIVCHPPPRGGMTEAMWLGMSVVGL